MPVRAVVGAQWGDEGKGRIVDYMAQKADVVIRFQGGDNAGHTVVNDYGKFALHILPSGIFNPDTLNIVGTGTVVNPDQLEKELGELRRLHKRSQTNRKTFAYLEGRLLQTENEHRLALGAFAAVADAGAHHSPDLWGRMASSHEALEQWAQEDEELAEIEQLKQNPDEWQEVSLNG